jgi:hypothetical protein
MMSAKTKHEINDIDIKEPSEELVDSIGFRAKAGNRIKDYVKNHGIVALSLRELMDLFLPPASSTYKSRYEFWMNIPILKQPQFGTYLYDSALLTLTEAELGVAFRDEWMLRLYSLKLHELKNCPANKRFQQTAKSHDY